MLLGFLFSVETERLCKPLLHTQIGFRLLLNPVQLNCFCFRKGQCLLDSGPLVPPASTWPRIIEARTWLVCALKSVPSLELPFPPCLAAQRCVLAHLPSSH